MSLSMNITDPVYRYKGNGVLWNTQASGILATTITSSWIQKLQTVHKQYLVH